VRIGRMAGQYAKPRSSPIEKVDGKEVPSFRGDILNGFDLDERGLDPTRLIRFVWLRYPCVRPPNILTSLAPTTTQQQR